MADLQSSNDRTHKEGIMIDENGKTTGQPVHKIRYGNVSAAVWANNSSAGYFFNTTFCRVYKQNDEAWGESTSFDDRDLPNLAKAAADAHSWIYEQKQNAVTTETIVDCCNN